jgi:hypothetical protein
MVIKATLFGFSAQGQNGIVRDGTITHGRNIQNTGRVGLSGSKLTGANLASTILFRHGSGPHTMAGPLVVDTVDIPSGSKGQGFDHIFGALINQASTHAVKGFSFQIIFHQILSNLGTDLFLKL